MDPDCDPAMLLRKDGSRLKNLSQNIPRANNKLKRNCEQWLKLQQAFAPVFSWVEALVRIIGFLK